MDLQVIGILQSSTQKYKLGYQFSGGTDTVYREENSARDLNAISNGHINTNPSIVVNVVRENDVPAFNLNVSNGTFYSNYDSNKDSLVFDSNGNPKYGKNVVVNIFNDIAEPYKLTVNSMSPYTDIYRNTTHVQIDRQYEIKIVVSDANNVSKVYKSVSSTIGKKVDIN
jgi:hypothetical protein